MKGGRLPPISYRSAGLELDYGPLLLKPLCEEFGVLASLRRAARKLGLPKPAYFGALVWPGLLGGPPQRARAAHAVHRSLVWLRELGVSFMLMGLQGVRLLRAVFSKRLILPKVDLLWMGIGANEYGEHAKKRCFYWPEKVCSGLKILYVLPRMPSPPFRSVLASENVWWITKFDILRFCSKPVLATLVVRFLQAAFSLILPWKGSWVLRARLCGFHFEALAWDAFARALAVKAAMSAGGFWTSTTPDLIALRRNGVRTALWLYSANSIPFNHPGGKGWTNGKLRTVHEADRIYVWNERAAGWYRENLCHHPRNEVVVVGPVMCGDASKCAFGRPAPDARLRISVFDVTKPTGELASRMIALPLPAEYHEKFWRDLSQVLRELPETVLTFKPKRSSSSLLHEQVQSFAGLAGDAGLLASGRIELVADDADPYEAIARSDVAICMPFTSPALVAWHFGRVGIFYDPANVAAFHRFEDFGRFFPKSREELTSVLVEVAEKKKLGMTPEFPGNLSDIIGRSPMENPQKTILDDLRAWAVEGDICQSMVAQASLESRMEKAGV